MEILQQYSALPEWGQISLFVFQALIFLLVGFKVGKTVRGIKAWSEKNNLVSEKETFQKNLKKLYEGENKKLAEDYAEAVERAEILEKKLEDYRKKISGLGLLSFSGNQKRADILYSLLIENETLEQLLYSQGNQMLSQHKQHLEEKLMNIRQRQRLVSELFNDQNLKERIKNLIDEEQDNQPSTSPKNHQNKIEKDSDNLRNLPSEKN